MMATRMEIEAALDKLAHLDRCIDILAAELEAVRGAARTPEARRLRAAADEMEMEALDLAKVCQINLDIDLLQDRANRLETEIREAVLMEMESIQGFDLEAVYERKIVWNTNKLEAAARAGHGWILDCRQFEDTVIFLEVRDAST